MTQPRMPRRALLAALAALPLPALAMPALAQPRAGMVEPPQVLRRGLNITNWFRFPASTEPARLRAYMPDAAMAEIRAAGFTAIRLCIQPQILLQPDGGLEAQRTQVVMEAIGRLHRAGLAVIVDAHPESWRPEDRPEEGEALLAFWRAMAPRLARLDPARTFVEVMNEPVFRDHEAWAILQIQALEVIRRALPRHLVVLTGADWGSIEGLLRLNPVPDRNVLYSIHDYQPMVLTHLAFWEQGHDRAALARLPFPVADQAACAAVARQTEHARTRELGSFYCREGWDAARIRRRYVQAAEWGRAAGAPIALLEFGCDVRVNAPARLAYVQAVREAAEAEGMGWALWGYADIHGFPRRDGPKPAELDAPLLRALGLAA